MEIGVFTKTFERETIEDVFEAVKAYACVQLNWESAGVDGFDVARWVGDGPVDALTLGSGPPRSRANWG